MQDFELYIDDDRYRTPTLMFLQMNDEARVREFARSKLEESAHYRGIEVRLDGLRLFGLGSLDDEAVS